MGDDNQFGWTLLAGYDATPFRWRDECLWLYLHFWNKERDFKTYINLTGQDGKLDWTILQVDYFAGNENFIITGSSDQGLQLYLHYCKSCNNETWQQGRPGTTDHTSQVMMTSLSLGHIINVYGFFPLL